MNIHDQDTFLRGKNEGYEAGIQQGMQQGMQQRAIETAKNMLKDNIPKNAIMKYTRLPTEVIEQLAKETNLSF